MRRRMVWSAALAGLVVTAYGCATHAQERSPEEAGEPSARRQGVGPNPGAEGPAGPGFFGRRGPGRPGGPGGPGGQELKLVKQFDKDADGRLNQEERAAARKYLQEQRPRGGRGFGPPGFGPPGGPGFPPGGPGFPPPGAPGFGPPGGPGFGPPGEGPGLAPPGERPGPGGPDARPTGPGAAPDAPRREGPDARQRRGFGPGGPRGGFGRRGNQEPPKPGPRVSPSEVKTYPKADLYEPTVLRTLFLDFENDDWEAELADFHNTDVEVPATLTVDGKKYPGVGIHFRGMSSYMMVGEGYKRSLNVAVDFTDEKQRLYGYRTLNLLNCNGDPSFLRGVLYSHIAQRYLPTPRCNLVKVVINGESWGVYANMEQINADFVKDRFGGTGGVRWKVPGSPGGGGGLAYFGDNVEDYKRFYEIKGAGSKAEEAWSSLIALSRAIEKTPPEKLEEVLEPILDLDGVLKYLALENVLLNSDGYWARASDFHLFRDAGGKFHIIPYDFNESFHVGGGPGFGRGGGGGVELDPLTGTDDPRKPLLSRLLAAPRLRDRYLRYVRTIAEESLDWKKLGPVVDGYRRLIESEVAADTRKLDSTEAFRVELGLAADTPQEENEGFFRRRPRVSLKTLVEQRRAYLLNHPEVKRAAPAGASPDRTASAAASS